MRVSTGHARGKVRRSGARCCLTPSTRRASATPAQWTAAVLILPVSFGNQGRALLLESALKSGWDETFPLQTVHLQMPGAVSLWGVTTALQAAEEVRRVLDLPAYLELRKINDTDYELVVAHGAAAGTKRAAVGEARDPIQTPFHDPAVVPWGTDDG
jgi:hypothetical protein